VYEGNFSSIGEMLLTGDHDEKFPNVVGDGIEGAKSFNNFDRRDSAGPLLK